MDVTKTPAPGTGAASSPAPERGALQAAATPPLADRTDIRPLDIPAALRILLAEVRASFQAQAIALADASGAAPENPGQAGRALLQMVLHAVADEKQGGVQITGTDWDQTWANAPEWNALLTRVENALQTGFDATIRAVAQWRDVPESVVDAAAETRALVLTILGDDPRNAIWLRPEWAGLAPGFERFWRRRRLARRRLTDPDYSSGSCNDDEPRP